jgi:hypothetical protein
MNAKKAKALRRMAVSITTGRGLPDRRTTDVPLGLNKVRSVNAADSTRGQYIALKKAVKGAYGRAAA